MDHLLIVATAFRLAGLALVIASVLALIDLANTALVMRRMPPVEIGKPLDIGTYGLIALIHNAARGVAWAMRALARLARVILVALAMAAVLTLLLGVLLYFTGRGIGQHAEWARIVAMLVSAGLVLAGCSIAARLMTVRRGLAPLAILPMGFSLYALWVLIWGFA